MPSKVSILKLSCPKCGLGSPEEIGFCSNCGYRLYAVTKYDITFDDYAYEPDKDGVETLKVMGVLPYLIKNLAYGRFEQELLSKFRSTRQRGLPSVLEGIVRNCASILSLRVLPEVFVIEGGQANAFTFGNDETAFVVADINLLQLLTTREATVLFAHELGHVKSGHMLYHTLAEALGGGIGLSASLLGFNIISVPIRLGLLSWHRESEVTADRASLLVSNDPEAIGSLMIKLASLSRHDPSALVGYDPTMEEPSMFDSVSEVLRTHPLYANRLKLMREFAQSHQFSSARRKMELGRALRRASIPVCRFCGERKTAADSFCPVCGRAQA